MLDYNPRCVFADFGLSRQLSCDYIEDELMTVRVYSGWYRPLEIVEYIKNNETKGFYTANADVWALGLTFAEYYAGVPVYKTADWDNPAKMIEAIKQSSSDGNKVDVRKFLIKHINRIHYGSISLEIIKAIENMLYLYHKERPTILDVIKPIKIKSFVHPLSRGDCVLLKEQYYTEIEWITTISINYKFLVRSVLNTIDMFERFFTYHIVNPEDIRLISLVILSISCLINENMPLNLVDYHIISSQQYNMQSIKSAQLFIAEKLQYCLSTCEIDILWDIIEDQPKPLQAIQNTYLGLLNSGIAPNKTSYLDISLSVNKYND
jgi:serine/threonine protein kinase